MLNKWRFRAFSGDSGVTVGRGRPKCLAVAIWLLLAGLQVSYGACVVTEKTSVQPAVAGDLIVLPVEINGMQASFLLDTGAQRSVATDAAVERLGLARDQWIGTTMSGIGGIDRRPNADPRSFSLGGVPLVRRTLNHDTSLAVSVIARADAVVPRVDGLLGRDYLSVFDIDVDMPHRRVTFYHVSGCSGRFLPWTSDYAAVPVEMPSESAIVVPVEVNGVKLRALLDSGASSSLIDGPGMFRLGIDLAKLESDPRNDVAGLGLHVVTMRRHQFQSLRVGDQIMQDPSLWVAPMRLRPMVDMLLGADWLSTRRVWISYATRQLFVAEP
jgi:hypothetical protein